MATGLSSECFTPHQSMSDIRLSAKSVDDIKLAGRKTVKECRAHVAAFTSGGPAANDSRKWLIDLIRIRLSSRFFDRMAPCEVWRDGQDPKSVAGNAYPNGFAVMAIACLLMETLQAFQEGVACHRGDTGNLILRFLKQDEFWKHGLHLGNEDHFLREIRNGLLHRGETRRWLIEKRHPTAIDEQAVPPVFGAWRFLAALHKALKTYLGDLSVLPAPDALWKTAVFKLEKGVVENAIGNEPPEGAKWLNKEASPFRWKVYKRGRDKAKKRADADAGRGKRKGNAVGV